jgi:hypothetical protein
MVPQSLLVPAATASIVVAPILALATWTRRPTRAGFALLLLAVSLAAIWTVYVLLYTADYRDADGFADCWPRCTAWQKSVGWTLFGGPILAVLVGALALITAVRARSS